MPGVKRSCQVERSVWAVAPNDEQSDNPAGSTFRKYCSPADSRFMGKLGIDNLLLIPCRTPEQSSLCPVLRWGLPAAQAPLLIDAWCVLCWYYAGESAPRTVLA